MSEYNAYVAGIQEAQVAVPTTPSAPSGLGKVLPNTGEVASAWGVVSISLLTLMSGMVLLKKKHESD